MLEERRAAGFNKTLVSALMRTTVPLGSPFARFAAGAEIEEAPRFALCLASRLSRIFSLALRPARMKGGSRDGGRGQAGAERG